jgi:hypothetical protein
MEQKTYPGRPASLEELERAFFGTGQRPQAPAAATAPPGSRPAQNPIQAAPAQPNAASPKKKRGKQTFFRPNFRALLPRPRAKGAPARGNPRAAAVNWGVNGALMLAGLLLVLFFVCGQADPGQAFGLTAISLTAEDGDAAGHFLLVRALEKSNLDIGDRAALNSSLFTGDVYRVDEVIQNFGTANQMGYRLSMDDSEGFLTADRNVMGKVLVAAPRLGEVFRYVNERFLLLACAYASLVIAKTFLRLLLAGRLNRKANDKG